MVSGAIRGYINNLDDFLDDDEEDMQSQTEIPTAAGKSKQEVWDFEHIHLGSRQRATTISSFIDHDDPAFENFLGNLAQCIHDILMHEYIDSCERQGTFSGTTQPPFPVVKDSDSVSPVHCMI